MIDDILQKPLNIILKNEKNMVDYIQYV